jgi:hypothetical protein
VSPSSTRTQEDSIWTLTSGQVDLGREESQLAGPLYEGWSGEGSHKSNSCTPTQTLAADHLRRPSLRLLPSHRRWEVAIKTTTSSSRSAAGYLPSPRSNLVGYRRAGAESSSTCSCFITLIVDHTSNAVTFLPNIWIYTSKTLHMRPSSYDDLQASCGCEGYT